MYCIFMVFIVFHSFGVHLGSIQMSIVHLHQHLCDIGLGVITMKYWKTWSGLEVEMKYLANPGPNKRPSQTGASDHQRLYILSRPVFGTRRRVRPPMIPAAILTRLATRQLPNSTTARQRPVSVSDPRPPASQRPSPAADLTRCTSTSCLAQLCGPPASVSGGQAHPSINQWSGLPTGRPIRPIQLMYV